MKRDYECQACEHTFVAEQKMSDDLLKRCPECKKHQLAQVFGDINFQLKGKGWCRPSDWYSSRLDD